MVIKLNMFLILVIEDLNVILKALNCFPTEGEFPGYLVMVQNRHSEQYQQVGPSPVFLREEHLHSIESHQARRWLGEKTQEKNRLPPQECLAPLPCVLGTALWLITRTTSIKIAPESGRAFVHVGSFCQDIKDMREVGKHSL